MDSAVSSDDPFPDLREAFRTTWFAALQQLSAAERALSAAEQSAAQARARADKLRRQIEAACPPLGLDPAAVMDDAWAASPPIEIPHLRVESTGPRARYEERVTDLLADGRVVVGEPLRTIHHGQEHFARIESDGFISGAAIGSKPTLSAAARALVGGERNGWKFWMVQRDGRWVQIADLRNT